MLVYLSLAWGFAFLLIAVGLRSFPPLTLVTLRLFLGALILYAVMRYYGHGLPRSPRWWLLFALLSLTGNLIPFSLITWAEVHIASGQAGLLMALMPISTLVLAHFFVQQERITGRRLVGVLLGFCGVAVLVGADALRGLGGPADAAGKLFMYARAPKFVAPHQYYAVYLMGECGPKAMPKLVALASADDACIRAAVAHALGGKNDSPAL